MTLEDAAASLHRFAAGIRADTRRRRGWGFGARQPPRKPDPARTLPAEDLLRARKAAGLSQRQLAAERGFSRGLVADIERGSAPAPWSWPTGRGARTQRTTWKSREQA